jgi:hypothetical protein
MTTRLRSARETRRRAMTARSTLLTLPVGDLARSQMISSGALAATAQQEDGLLTE